MNRNARYACMVYFIVVMFAVLFLLHAVYGCSRLNDVRAVQTINHQEDDDCSLKCYYDGPKVPATRLIEEYTCDDWPCT